MAYIVYADVLLGIEINQSGNCAKVNARVLAQDDSHICFDIPGDFKRQKEITKELCNTLIDAGFYSFNVGHSF